MKTSIINNNYSWIPQMGTLIYSKNKWYLANSAYGKYIMQMRILIIWCLKDPCWMQGHEAAKVFETAAYKYKLHEQATRTRIRE